MLLYRIMSNKFPFDANNLAQLALRITQGSFPPLSPKYSPLLQYTPRGYNPRSLSLACALTAAWLPVSLSVCPASAPDACEPSSPLLSLHAAI